MAQCPNGFRLSSYLQEIIAYLGSDYVFEEASHLLEKLLSINVSAKQLQTVSEYMGDFLEQEAQKQEDNTSISTKLEVSQQVYTYVQLDGSMVLTREEKWKEMKLGHRDAGASFKFISKRHMLKSVRKYHPLNM